MVESSDDLPKILEKIEKVCLDHSDSQATEIYSFSLNQYLRERECKVLERCAADHVIAGNHCVC